LGRRFLPFSSSSFHFQPSTFPFFYINICFANSHFRSNLSSIWFLLFLLTAIPSKSVCICFAICHVLRLFCFNTSSRCQGRLQERFDQKHDGRYVLISTISIHSLFFFFFFFFFFFC
jgi:hypothetical protein